MKKYIVYILIAACAMTISCKQEDVFATWRDPSKTIIKSDESYFTMMQYNILGADEGWDSERFDRVSAVISSQKPDFVTLNEVDSMTTRNPVFMARELADRTGMNYAFTPAIREGDKSWGNWDGVGAFGDAVLSKHPILEVRRFHMMPDDAQGTNHKEMRSVCAIRVNLKGHDIWIASTHLDHRTEETSRIYQVRQLRDDVIPQLGSHLVLCGDLNANPDKQSMLDLQEFMVPQHPSFTQEYYTFPSKMLAPTPDRLLDYVLLRKDETLLRKLSYRVVNSPASDHCAVVATFRIVE